MAIAAKKVTLLGAFRNYANLLARVKIEDAQGRSLGESGFKRALDLIIKQNKLGKKLCFIGNGGSAAIASHQATDFFKNGGVRAASFNDASILTCLANDYNYTEIFSRQIERMTNTGDILFAISSSGKSSNIIKGVEAARRNGCHIVTCSGFDENNPLRRLGEVNFYVPSHSYAHVENAHLLICHTFVDALMALRGEPPFWLN
ncbi:MAG: SIS domain-containing protein [Elusimicrobia bacterium]|nr:SIS domain-containing protein [Elusimicrobiota bacterium]